MPDYIVTPTAQRQMEEIWLYSSKQWGETQANKYINQLTQTFTQLSQGIHNARSYEELERGLRSCRCKHHYIFYLDERPPKVVAVLHERMDVLTRLTNLLK